MNDKLQKKQDLDVAKSAIHQERMVILGLMEYT